MHDEHAPRSATSLTRRECFTAATALAAAAAASTLVPATAEAAPPRALAGQHTVKPLPFRAGALRGLSERLILSHHQKNYGGAVKNLNAVEKELARVGPGTPGFTVTALRERELTFRNSKLLHEAYFANLGGNGRAHGQVAAAIAAAYGGFGAFESQLRRTALGLGGGSGWVVLACELDTGGLRLVGSGHHTQALAAGWPLLVLDMYEHSYALDYGADHGRYIEAFWQNVQWDEVERRYRRARRAAGALAR